MSRCRAPSIEGALLFWGERAIALIVLQSRYSLGEQKIFPA